MPYNSFDSDDTDDLIVLEIPTDEEDEEGNGHSDSSLAQYAGLGKRTGSIHNQETSVDEEELHVKIKKESESPGGTHLTKKRGRPPGSKTKMAVAKPSIPITITRNPIKQEIIKSEQYFKEDDKNMVFASTQSYSTMTDAEVDAIIETDLSVGAEFVTEDVITEDIHADAADGDAEFVEEKVFTELPNKYLLYDELIATIIGFDGETPIVEFSSITREELKQCEKKLPVECGVCPSIISFAHLSEHLKMHQDPETKRYNCIYCDNSACNRHSAASHSRRHLGIRPYACDICDNYFTTKNDLKLHYQRKHLEREFICEMCGKTYAQNTFLKRHIESHHQGKRPHQCNYCPKSYHRRGNLKEHVEAVHMGNRKPLSCRFCGIEFRDSHKLSRHRKEEHLNKSHFECTPCGVEFTDIQFFNAHKRSIQCKNNRLALKTEDTTTNEEAVEVVLS